MTDVPARESKRVRWERFFAPAALVLLGVVVFWPALRSRFYLDDHFHAAMLAGRWPTHRSVFDLYHFVSDGDRGALASRGVIPWWSSPTLSVRFLRPLSSLLLAIDYRLLHGSVFAMHLHSLAWWAACVLGAHRLYARVLGMRAAWIATVIFALAPCHVVPLAWLANREALVSLAFGIGAITCMLHVLETGRMRDVSFAAAASSLALLGGEYGLSLLGYVGVMAFFRSEVPLRRRLLVCASFGVPTAIYLLARVALRCGAHGGGFYLDPLSSPVAFLREVPRRFATLLSELWLSSDGRLLEGTSAAFRVAVAAGVVVLVADPLRQSLTHREGRERTDLLWMLVGSLLSLVPVLAVAPHPRVLGAAMLGTAPVVGTLLADAWWPPALPARRGRAEWAVLVATGLGFAHLVHAPVTSWLIARQFRNVTAFFEATAERVAKSIPPNDGEKASPKVVIVRGLGAAFYLPFALDEQFGRKASWSVLAQGDHVLVMRHDARTLDLVSPAGGSIFPAGLDQIFRSDDEHFHSGDSVATPDMKVTVLEANAAGPRRVRFEFDHDLDDGSTTWLSEGTFGVSPVTLPKVGFGLPLPR